MKFDIPINITVTATNEALAEKSVMDFMIKSMKEFGVECSVTDFEYFEFIADKASDSRRRDKNVSEGQRSCAKEQSCHCSKQSCC